MTTLPELFLPGAERAVEKYRKLYEEELARVIKMIAETKEAHASMPNNYWHLCHELRGKYILAIQLKNSLQEITKKDPNKP